MKKTLSLILVALGMFATATVNAADLIQAYNQALMSDPTYHKQIDQALSTEEGIPIARALLFPQINGTVVPLINKTKNTGPAAITSAPAADTFHSLSMNLTLTQTIFNFEQFSALQGAKASARQALANLNYQLQDLMLRVAKAYTDVLEAEDNLAYSKANKDANAKQLDQVNQQYKVGLKTLTDVYTAQASYDISLATFIAAETRLANNKETLRAITNVYYPHLAKLSEKFPLRSPQPANMEKWVRTALQQNWSIRAAQYGVQAACEAINQQLAGHLPTLNLQGMYNVVVSHTDAPTIFQFDNMNVEAVRPGSGKYRTASLQLNLAVPIFAGGGVVAATNQARFNYRAQIQQLEFTARDAVKDARQKYLDVTSGIKQIYADRAAVKSAIASFEGLQEGYLVGTQTLVDVLNQLQKVFSAQLQYAHDRYAYVNNLLLLKNAAGTLSQEDLVVINSWLVNNRRESAMYNYDYDGEKQHKHKNKKVVKKKKVIKIITKKNPKKKSEQNTIKPDSNSQGEKVSMTFLDEIKLKLTPQQTQWNRV